jgi:glycosyltransferase involved in cell wall biosynthesis
VRDTLRVAVNGWFLDRPAAGSGQYLHHLLTHLPRLPRTLQLHLLIPPELADAARAYPHITAVPVALPNLPRPLRKLWWEQVSIPRAARRLGVDLLWVPYWAAPAWQPCPVAVTVHDLIPMLLPPYRGGLPQRLYTRLVSWTAQRAAAVITVSHASAEDIRRELQIPPERVHVVYHGPNHAPHTGQQDAQALDPQELDAVRRRYGLPEHYFLYLGGFDVRKNVEGIVAAYARYLALGGDPGVKLVLAGILPVADTPFAPAPQRLIATHHLESQVRLCGWVEERDKAALYALATAFIFPSYYEGFGMMVLEAMAAGTPVITSG